MTERSGLVDVLVRPMALADLKRVHEIDVRSFSLPWSERSFRYDLTQNPSARMWVAEVVHPDGRREVVGSMVLWIVVDEAHLGTIAVAPEFRRRGIGEKMIMTMMDACRRENAVSIYLEVRVSNLPAQTLYRKFGFEPVGIRKRYYKDNHEDALLMTCDLTRE
ncbi:MAG: ribosomal protein S18-alanine N-acetyltransferase [Anaerolineaceae bacterium]|nr:ribosomal protein S18-alanine N-acetyltransferase [Anaerolineaceae bacterium]